MNLPHATAKVNLAIDTFEVHRALSVLKQPGEVVELRGLDVVEAKWQGPHMWSGYFNDFTSATASIEPLTKCVGIYFTLQQINPALLARAQNKGRGVKKEPTTSDGDVVRMRWLLIDCDPTRPSGISSTDAEHDAAIDRAKSIREIFTARGWPLPIVGDSGNGAHLLYAIDLPTSDSSLIETVLKAGAFHFNTDAVNIDEKVFNPSRICRMYGTVTCKGDNTLERPHRVSRLLEIPKEIHAVGREQLQAFAATMPTPAVTKPTGQRFDLDAFMQRSGLQYSERDWSKGRRFIFDVYPWDAGHTDRSAFVLQFADGAMAAGCHHNGCSGKNWHALRDVVEPGWQDRKASRLSGHTEPPCRWMQNRILTRRNLKIIPPLMT
jgi:hypothetical protein